MPGGDRDRPPSSSHPDEGAADESAFALRTAERHSCEAPAAAAELPGPTTSSLTPRPAPRRSRRAARARASRTSHFARCSTAFGAAAVTFMMLMYALERRGRGFIFAFGCGCVLSRALTSFFLAGTWPFGIVELIWAGIAFNRYRNTPRKIEQRPQQAPRSSAGRDSQRAQVRLDCTKSPAGKSRARRVAGSGRSRTRSPTFRCRSLTRSPRTTRWSAIQVLRHTPGRVAGPRTHRTAVRGHRRDLPLSRPRRQARASRARESSRTTSHGYADSSVRQPHPLTG